MDAELEELAESLPLRDDVADRLAKLLACQLMAMSDVGGVNAALPTPGVSDP